MSGTTIIWTLLKNNVALIGVVPATRIVTGTMPQGVSLPAIGVALVSGADRNIPSPASTVFVTDRVQVSVLARNYTEQLDVMKKVRAACRDQHGTIANFAGVSVTTDVRGADSQFGELTGIYVETQDFKVMYSESP